MAPPLTYIQLLRLILQVQSLAALSGWSSSPTEVSEDKSGLAGIPLVCESEVELF